MKLQSKLKDVEVKHYGDYSHVVLDDKVVTLVEYKRNAKNIRDIIQNFGQVMEEAEDPISFDWDKFERAANRLRDGLDPVEQRLIEFDHEVHKKIWQDAVDATTAIVEIASNGELELDNS